MTGMTPHDDRVRGFPAFPPEKGGRRATRARSWWGNAWLTALEDTSLDPEPLRRGRAYARAGHVGPITVSPGRIAAPVYGDDGTPYRAVVYVERLTDAEWERFLDEAAVRAGHLAALLDREMPRELAEAATDAGVRLLPGLGDLEPECGCPDWELPCQHAAALCYQAARLLDEDPFVLLLLRGRGERELLDETARRNVSAGRALHGVSIDPAGAVPAGRGAPVERPLLAAPPAPGVDPDALELLRADAAVRARELLATGGSAEPRPVLDVWQDTIRLAATHPDDARLLARLRAASGRSAKELARAVRAWKYGGPAGLDVLKAPWSPPGPDLARGRAALYRRDGGVVGDGAADDPPPVRIWRNRMTVTEPGGGRLQLRYGRDGRWYPYRVEAGDWWPAGPPRRDPAAALVELLADCPP